MQELKTFLEVFSYSHKKRPKPFDLDLDTKDCTKSSVLFVTKENQKVFTGPNLHPPLKNSYQFVYEFLKALLLPKA